MSKRGRTEYEDKCKCVIKGSRRKKKMVVRLNQIVTLATSHSPPLAISLHHFSLTAPCHLSPPLAHPSPSLCTTSGLPSPLARPSPPLTASGSPPLAVSLCCLWL